MFCTCSIIISFPTRHNNLHALCLAHNYSSSLMKRELYVRLSAYCSCHPLRSCLPHTLIHNFFLLIVIHKGIIQFFTKFLFYQETYFIVLRLTAILLYYVRRHGHKFLTLNNTDIAYHKPELKIYAGKTTKVASIFLKNPY